MTSRFGGGGDNARDWYDSMQVCMNGHRITAHATSEPNARQDFCDQCGAETIMSCPDCGGQIRGHRHAPGRQFLIPREPPSYCTTCGHALPWQQAKLENLDEVLDMGGISAEDRALVRSAINDVAKETPKSESATLKVKEILKKLGGDFYGVALKVVTDIASEYSKKMLGVDK